MPAFAMAVQVGPLGAAPTNDAASSLKTSAPPVFSSSGIAWRAHSRWPRQVDGHRVVVGAEVDATASVSGADHAGERSAAFTWIPSMRPWASRGTSMSARTESSSAMSTPTPAAVPAGGS